ncbi:unnamed protein product [Prunus armeniaca]
MKQWPEEGERVGERLRKKLSNTACFLAVSSDYGGGSGELKAGAGRGKCGGSKGTGLASIGSRS